ncbi:hypothetical protein [Shivajiella indica]|uniref:Right-handed parallel beta-helix repeat-containing protein n=1 Tax=Shivajiella indica TaxID=872115 RepID=A0ABW5B419_9BACT
MKKLILFYLSIIIVLSLNGCHEEISFPIIESITAIAGEDQEVWLNSEVLLYGSSEGATDPVEFYWSFRSKPEESTTEIVNPHQADASFNPDKVGEYILELKASKGELFDLDELKVIVHFKDNEGPNEPGNGNSLFSDIDQDLVLEDVHEDPAIPDYIVSAEIAVNAKLTIKPGVVIQFEENTGLKINPLGSINAKGTINNRIFFTGKEKIKGFWKGILIYSNSEENVLENVSISFGGSESFQEMPFIKGNLILQGDQISASAINLKNSTISESGGYGLYLAGKSYFNVFENNNFSNNLLAAAYVPAGQLHKLNFHSRFNDNNGFNGIETGGELDHYEAIQWTAFNDRSAYLVSSDLIIKSGLKIMEGAIFEMIANKMIQIEGNGYLDATGSEVNRVVFTARDKTLNGFWKGIHFNSLSLNNKLIRTEVSYAGSTKFSGFDKKGNVLVSGRLLTRDSRFHHGLGYGVVAQQPNLINSDVATSNIFSDFSEGFAYPEVLNNPEPPSIVGDWVDWWSLNEEYYTVDTKLYDKTNNIWFKGGADPWNMTAQQGFGLKVSESGKFIWTIAERHHFDPGCISYSAEFITGTIQVTNSLLTFSQDFWKSKFENSCAPDQNVDEQITPGNIPIKYEINRVFNPNSGKVFWELKFTNPDNSTFSYFRL